MFQAGQQIGLYKLIERLGRGGFGEVWLAEKRSQFVTKRVAVKLPHEDQINLDAIHKEATLWEQASGHPNVLPIIDADIIDGQVVIVSEYADGGSLADKLKREGILPLKQAVETTIGILHGLEFLHHKQIIHRDIKPANILLQGNTPRLADFGISRAMHTTAISSAIIGTDAYMAPEAFDGKRSIQTDLWSVGVILYQLLAGNLPFPQEHPSEKIFAILTKEYPPLPNSVPHNLHQIVTKALAKLPEHRFQTAGEMRDELQKALISIAHPAHAPTELLRFPISQENSFERQTVENRFETGEIERESIVNNQQANSPAATQPSFPQQSVVTQFKQTPSVENKPLPTEVMKKAGATSDNISQDKAVDFSNGVLITGAGIIIFLIILGFVIMSARESTNYSGSLYTASNLKSNSQSPTPTPGAAFEMNAELKAIEHTITIEIIVDGKSSYVTLLSGETKSFTAKNSVILRYTRFLADYIQLKINDRNITLLKPSETTGNVIEHEITIDNFNQAVKYNSNTNNVTVNTKVKSSSSANSNYKF